MASSNHRRDLPEEYELVEYPESITSSVGSRLSLFARELGFDRSRHGRSQENGLIFRTRWSASFSNGCSANLVINPDGIFYRWWTRFILVWAVYSSCFTPFEFGFYRGLPKHLWPLDVTVQMIFFADLIVQFFLAYRDSHSYRMIYDRRSIALRYAKTSFVLDFLGCLPWDIVYKMDPPYISSSSLATLPSSSHEDTLLLENTLDDGPNSPPALPLPPPTTHVVPKRQAYGVIEEDASLVFDHMTSQHTCS